MLVDMGDLPQPDMNVLSAPLFTPKNPMMLPHQLPQHMQHPHYQQHMESHDNQYNMYQRQQRLQQAQAAIHNNRKFGNKMMMNPGLDGSMNDSSRSYSSDYLNKDLSGAGNQEDSSKNYASNQGGDGRDRPDMGPGGGSQGGYDEYGGVGQDSSDPNMMYYHGGPRGVPEMHQYMGLPWQQMPNHNPQSSMGWNAYSIQQQQQQQFQQQMYHQHLMQQQQQQQWHHQPQFHQSQYPGYERYPGMSMMPGGGPGGMGEHGGHGSFGRLSSAGGNSRGDSGQNDYGNPLDDGDGGDQRDREGSDGSNDESNNRP